MKYFKIYHEDYMGADFWSVYAYSHEGAAKAYGRHFNSQNENFLLKEGIAVWVEEEKGAKLKIQISAEPNIIYYTDLIE